MWFAVCRWQQSHEGDWVRPRLCKLAQRGPRPVRKRFTNHKQQYTFSVLRTVGTAVMISDIQGKESAVINPVVRCYCLLLQVRVLFLSFRNVRFLPFVNAVC